MHETNTRDNLDQKIKKTIDQYDSTGLIDEVAYLIEKYNNENHNSMRCVGQTNLPIFTRKVSIKELEDLIFFVRQYAKDNYWQNRWKEEYYIYVNEHQARINLI